MNGNINGSCLNIDIEGSWSNFRRFGDRGCPILYNLIIKGLIINGDLTIFITHKQCALGWVFSFNHDQVVAIKAEIGIIVVDVKGV